MKVLAVDTSAKTATVALLEDNKIISEYSIYTNTHSTTLLPMIESVFDFAGISAKDVDLYAVSVGPGSFTGIRIGVSTVKGLAFVHNTPCVGVSALEAMAENFRGVEGIIVPAIDARRDMVYTAIFKSEKNGSLTRLTEDSQIAISELLALLKEHKNADIYFTGDAYDKLTSYEGVPTNVASTPTKLRTQSAYGVAAAALNIWNASEDKSTFTDSALMPVYLKKSQAEREREERLAASDN